MDSTIFTTQADTSGKEGIDLSASYTTDTSEQSSLPKLLNGRDLTVFSMLTIITLSSVSSIVAGGPTTFIFWLLVFVIFLVPRAVVGNWMVRHIKTMETPYHWAKAEKGPGVGFFTTLCIWWPGVFIIASIVQAHLELVEYFVRTVPVVSSPLLQGTIIVSLLLMGMGVSCIPLRWLKYGLLAAAVSFLSLLLFIGVVGLWEFFHGHVAAFTHPVPSSGNAIVSFGLAILPLLGIHIPIFLSPELAGEQKVRKTALSRFHWWSSILACGTLFLGTFGIQILVPPAQMASITSPIIAMGIIFGPGAIIPTAYLLGFCQLGAASAVLLLYSRLLVVLANEKRLPSLLARTNRYGVPVFSIGIQSIIASTFAILMFVLLPNLLSHISSPVKILLDIHEDLNVVILHSMQTGAFILLACTSSFMYTSSIARLGQIRRKQDKPWRDQIPLAVVAMMGLLGTMVGVWSVMAHTQIRSYFNNFEWAIALVVVIIFLILFGWFISIMPSIVATLEEERRLSSQEANLRAQLQESYEQQVILLEEVDQLYRKHAEAAVTDAITNLPNHRAVMSRVDEMLEECKRKQKPCAILFTDLDHFKRVNDTWGHRAGDAILREVGNRFRTTIRTQDLVGRYGGEEFAILLDETDIEEASQVAERLRTAVASTPCMWQEDGQDPLPIPVSTSIGVAAYPLHGSTREQLITSADQAMYRAKKSGRNRVCIADLEQDDAESQKTTSLSLGSEREIVQALTAAASARDSETQEHSQRILILAEATARQLGRSEEEIHLIRIAALLHDIGKIGIPDSILHKPGPLTSDEWAIMRSHPDIGRAILEQTGGILRLLSNIVVAHHERWDGTGYPSQLVGEDIPLGARILSVVDSYDAMVSHRAYRERLTNNEAIEELKRCAGSQFDPQTVSAFLAVLEEKPQLITIDAA